MQNTKITITNKTGVTKEFKTMKQAKKQLRLLGWTNCEIIEQKVWDAAPILKGFFVSEWNYKEVGYFVKEGAYRDETTEFSYVRDTPKTYSTIAVTPILKDNQLFFDIKKVESRLGKYYDTDEKYCKIEIIENTKEGIDMNQFYEKNNLTFSFDESHEIIYNHLIKTV